MGKLFGTDGIRGVANQYPITPETVLQVGRAVAAVLKKNSHSKIIIGKDGRISGDMLEAALSAGICSVGADVYLAGLIPTPAIAFLTARIGADAGIMVSASHNPYTDNGIKIFDGNGFKLDSLVENAIEQRVLSPERAEITAEDGNVGMMRHLEGANGTYAAFLKSGVENSDFLKGMRLVIDCSNGATSITAPLIFEELGARVTVICNHPDGTNINKNCGSQHVQPLRRKVLETNADAGLAFDGDGDRLIAVDETGEALTGDHILAICARHMKHIGRLHNNLVVSTVMSNVGLINALKEMGIQHLIADVGDRHVLAEMQKNGSVIGGEDSGHMIFLDHHTSGDGIYTALRLLEVACSEGKPLSELRRIMTVYPQVLKNVRIKEKTDIFKIPEIADIIGRVENRLGGRGRVLVRYSGTQPLCRVMVEGPEPEETERLCQDIVDVVATKLGG